MYVSNKKSWILNVSIGPYGLPAKSPKPDPADRINSLNPGKHSCLWYHEDMAHPKQTQH